MKLPVLKVILRRDHQRRIVAQAEQMTSEGLKRGTNLLKGKHPRNFAEARTLVQKAYGNLVGELVFVEESQEWE